MGRAPIPSLLGLFRVGLKSDLGSVLTFAESKALGNQHGGSVLINRAALYIRLL